MTSGATTSKTLTVPVGTAKITVKNSASGCSTITTGVAVTVTGPNSYTATVTSNSSGLAQIQQPPIRRIELHGKRRRDEDIHQPDAGRRHHDLKLSVSGLC